MGYDRNRWVAPGVPRISEKFIKEHITMKDTHEGSLESGFDEENNYLASVVSRDKLATLKKAFVCVRAGMNIDTIKKEGLNDFLIRGALVHNGLMFAGNYKHPMFCESGLSYFSKEFARQFVSDMNDKIKKCGDLYFIFEEMQCLDERMGNLIKRLGLMNQMHYAGLDVSSVSEVGGFLFQSTEVGREVAYKILREQSEIYRLEDQFGV